MAEVSCHYSGSHTRVSTTHNIYIDSKDYDDIWNTYVSVIGNPLAKKAFYNILKSRVRKYYRKLMDNASIVDITIK